MATQGDVRNFQDRRLGDFITCEVLVGAQWREVHVFDTAMEELGGGGSRVEIFESEAAWIGAVAAKRAHEFAAGAPIRLSNLHLRKSR